MAPEDPPSRADLASPVAVYDVGRFPGNLIPRRMQPAARAAYYLLRGCLNRGPVHCPCCDWKVKLRPYNGRPNEVCPRCGSMGRNRALMLHLNSLNLRDPRVLHVAPEFGLERRLRAVMRNYLTADLTSPWANLKLDLTRTLQPDASFDVIICSHVLEHIPDDRAAMREMFRILHPGGRALLQIPIEFDRAVTFEDWSITDPARRAVVFGHPEHVRIYGRDFSDRLRSVGFAVTEARYELEHGPDTVFDCLKP